MPARRTGPSPGTLNDLYRLPNSVFNDDNIHAVLTGFDMLVLRTTYTPELRNGIGRVQAASIIGPLLAPAPPRRERGGRGNFPVTSRDWITAMETALTNGSSPGAGASPSTARSGLRSGSAGAARARGSPTTRLDAFRSGKIRPQRWRRSAGLTRSIPPRR